MLLALFALPLLAVQQPAAPAQETVPAQDTRPEEPDEPEFVSQVPS